MSYLYKNTNGDDISEFLSQTSNSDHALDLSELGYGVADHAGTNNPEYTDATKNTEITSSGTGFTFKGSDPFQTANSDGQRPVSYFTHAVNTSTTNSVQNTINIANNDAPSWATHCRIVFAGAGGGGGGSSMYNNGTPGAVGGSGGSGTLFISDTIPLTGSDALDSIEYYLGHGGSGGVKNNPSDINSYGTDGQDGGDSQLRLKFSGEYIDIRAAGGLKGEGGKSTGYGHSGNGGYFYASNDANFPDNPSQASTGNVGVYTIPSGPYSINTNLYSSSLYGTASSEWKYYGWSSVGRPGASSSGNTSSGKLNQWTGNSNYLRSYVLENIGKGGKGGNYDSQFNPQDGNPGQGAEIYVHWLPKDINLNADAAAVVNGLVTRFDYTDGTQKTWTCPFISDNGYDIYVTIVGGGGGGGGSDSNNDEYNGTGGGGGGEGGKVNQQTYSNIPANTVFTYTVGAGGNGGNGGVNDPGPPYVFNNPDDGADGSGSSISFSSNSLTVDGGSGGKKSSTPGAGQGGGSGMGAGYSGQNGTSSAGGNGGNGGMWSANERGTAGNGGNYGGNGGNGSYGGGGGGAGGPPPSQWDVDGPAISGSKGGKGGNGYIEIRWQLR